MKEKKKLIRSDEWIVDVLRALGIDYTMVRRVIIDARCGELPVLHLEHYADERILDAGTPEPDEIVVHE